MFKSRSDTLSTRPLDGKSSTAAAACDTSKVFRCLIYRAVYTVEPLLGGTLRERASGCLKEIGRSIEFVRN